MTGCSTFPNQVWQTKWYMFGFGGMALTYIPPCKLLLHRVFVGQASLSTMVCIQFALGLMSSFCDNSIHKSQPSYYLWVHDHAYNSFIVVIWTLERVLISRLRSWSMNSCAWLQWSFFHVHVSNKNMLHNLHACQCMNHAYMKDKKSCTCCTHQHEFLQSKTSYWCKYNSKSMWAWWCHLSNPCMLMFDLSIMHAWKNSIMQLVAFMNMSHYNPWQVCACHSHLRDMQTWWCHGCT